MLLIPVVGHEVDGQCLHRLAEVVIGGRVGELLILHVECVASECADCTATNYEGGEETEGKASRAKPLLDGKDGLAPAIVLVGVGLALRPVVEHLGALPRRRCCTILADVVFVTLVAPPLRRAMRADEGVDGSATAMRYTVHRPVIRAKPRRHHRPIA